MIVNFKIFENSEFKKYLVLEKHYNINMKYLKTFEDIEQEFEVGDYVKVDSNTANDIDIKEFLKDNIGTIDKILSSLPYGYIIKFINIPKSFLPSQRPANHYQAFHSDRWSVTKKNIRHATLEEIKQHKMKEDTIKYNL